MKDLYEILGVEKDADQHAIRSAYKLKARDTHPDKEGGTTDAFQELNEAYSVLRNSDKRAKYDAGESTADKPTVNDKAAARLAQYFSEVIPSATDTVDLVEVLREKVSSLVVSLTSNIDDLRKVVNNYEHVLKRVKYSGDGNDVFAGQVSMTISAANHNIDQISEEIELHQLIMKMLSDYSCEVEEPVYDSGRMDVATMFSNSRFSTRG